MLLIEQRHITYVYDSSTFCEFIELLEQPERLWWWLALTGDLLNRERYLFLPHVHETVASVVPTLQDTIHCRLESSTCDTTEQRSGDDLDPFRLELWAGLTAENRA